MKFWLLIGLAVESAQVAGRLVRMIMLASFTNCTFSCIRLLRTAIPVCMLGAALDVIHHASCHAELRATAHEATLCTRGLTISHNAQVDGGTQTEIAALYNMTDDTFVPFHIPESPFCSGHTLLPDGRGLVVGGEVCELRFRNIVTHQTRASVLSVYTHMNKAANGLRDRMAVLLPQHIIAWFLEGSSYAQCNFCYHQGLQSNICDGGAWVHF